MTPIKTQSAKGKGREHQKWIRQTILDEFHEFEDDDVIWTSMGASGIDIRLSPFAQKEFPVSIEAKATKKVPALKELKQAEHNKYMATTAAVVWKPHGAKREDSLIMLNFRDFLKLLKRMKRESIEEWAEEANKLGNYRSIDAR